MIKMSKNIFSLELDNNFVSSLSHVITQSFQSPFFKHIINRLDLKLDRWLTQQVLMSDIPSQMHPFSFISFSSILF